MKRALQLITVSLFCISISGCIALAAGAAGGYYVGHKYDIGVKKKSSTSTADASKSTPQTQQSSNTTTETAQQDNSNQTTQQQNT